MKSALRQEMEADLPERSEDLIRSRTPKISSERSGDFIVQRTISLKIQGYALIYRLKCDIITLLYEIQTDNKISGE